LDVGVEPLGDEAGGPKVDDLDRGLVGRTEEDVFGLEVAMNNVLFAEKFEGVSQLEGDAAHERQRHALELVVLDELVEVDREHLKGDAHV
jgi:hypothetical protein